MELLDRIKQLAEIHAIDFIGVAGIANYQKEIRSIGGVLGDSFPRAIVIGIILPMSIVDILHDREIYENVFQYRKHAYDFINQRLDSFTSMVSSIIQKNGHRVMPVPAAERIDNERVCASISHKLTARLAGFGWIGKNCLLIHPDHGPRIRWTTVLTDAPLPENETVIEEQCGSCNCCAEVCPAQAIRGRNFIEDEPLKERLDVAKCEAYFAELEKAKKLSVCGMCLYVCPYGR